LAGFVLTLELLPNKMIRPVNGFVPAHRIASNSLMNQKG
jgi:hypothetical protein